MIPLVIIPARGGSKGVPRKNIKQLNGKPLIQYTIDAARAVFQDEVICVSTDDLEIKSVVESLGLKVPFLRPEELAIDTAGTYEVLLHAIAFYEAKGYHADTIILLQPTSPFRTAEHLKNALQLYSPNSEMLASVKETHANPYFVLREENTEGWLVKSKEGNFTSRQDCPKVYELNGAIYIINVTAMKNRHIMSFERVSKYLMDDDSSLDIDNQLDWIMAEAIVKTVSI
jgi:CMP-N,N'-diacetyllegionaminic acid synthase